MEEYGRPYGHTFDKQFEKSKYEFVLCASVEELGVIQQMVIAWRFLLVSIQFTYEGCYHNWREGFIILDRLFD